MTVMKRIKLFDQSIDQKEFSAVKKTLEMIWKMMTKVTMRNQMDMLI